MEIEAFKNFCWFAIHKANFCWMILFEKTI